MPKRVYYAIYAVKSSDASQLRRFTWQFKANIPADRLFTVFEKRRIVISAGYLGLNPPKVKSLASSK